MLLLKPFVFVVVEAVPFPSPLYLCLREVWTMISGDELSVGWPEPEGVGLGEEKNLDLKPPRPNIEAAGDLCGVEEPDGRRWDDSEGVALE